MTRFGAFVSFPAMLGLAFIGREFILIALGEKWINSVPILQIFCLYGAVAFLANLYYLLLLSYGKSNIVMWFNILFSLLTIIAAIITSRYDIQVMAAAYVALCILSIGGWHYFAGKLIGLKFISLVKDIAPYLGIASGCIVIAWFLTRSIENLYLLLFSKMLIVTILYTSIIWFSGSVILKESVSFLLKKRTKK